MPRPEDDGNPDPAEPFAPPPATGKPPLLDYPGPGPVAEGEYGESESWTEIGRAILIVFGVLGVLFFLTFGLCGVFAHGCG